MGFHILQKYFAGYIFFLSHRMFCLWSFGFPLPIKAYSTADFDHLTCFIALYIYADNCLSTSFSSSVFLYHDISDGYVWKWKSCCEVLNFWGQMSGSNSVMPKADPCQRQACDIGKCLKGKSWITIDLGIWINQGIWITKGRGGNTNSRALVYRCRILGSRERNTHTHKT